MGRNVNRAVGWPPAPPFPPFPSLHTQCPSLTLQPPWLALCVKGKGIGRVVGSHFSSCLRAPFPIFPLRSYVKGRREMGRQENVNQTLDVSFPPLGCAVMIVWAKWPRGGKDRKTSNVQPPRPRDTLKTRHESSRPREVKLS